MDDNDRIREISENRTFATTSWSLIAAAVGQDGSSTESQEAMAALCQQYWMPLYAFARRRGYSAADAADATQGFFAQLLEKHFLNKADQECGRFRSFLLTVFKRYLSHERDRQQATRRGGGVRIVPLNAEDEESRYCLEPVDERTPEKIYDRRWAIVLLDSVLKLIETEYAEKGKSELFGRCRHCLTGADAGEGYAAIAACCGISETAVKVAVHRMRARFRELLRAEVSRTLAPGDDTDDEIRTLIRAVAE